MNVQEKLLKVQLELKAPKSQYNSFGKYNYRSCEDIQEAVKPLLQSVKALIITGDEVVMIGGRYYIKATAKFIDCESGEILSNVAYAREEESKKGMDASQVTGSASSYARKYALNGLLNIDDVKDADSNNTSSSSNSKNSKSKGQKKDEATAGKMVDAAMINTIQTLVKKYSSKGLKMEKILSMYSISSISEMTIDNFKDCMEKLKLYENGGNKNE